MPVTFETRNLAVGYNKNILIQGINIHLVPGTILTLIGPNGAGKSTILKTITRQLRELRGMVFIDDISASEFSNKEFAKKTSVVLTERVAPERMTCAEVTAMGRYPYTDLFGSLSEHDIRIVRESLKRVHALDLANRDFSELSDGQRQRILLARAICQEPEIIVLDEPTAYLDIRYKIEMLEIMQKMAREKGTIVIMSLHEIDLAMKISDELLCIDGKNITAYGTPEEIFSSNAVEKLYELHNGTYNPIFGSVEMPKTSGEPLVFVIAGNGKGTPFFRLLQRRGILFAAGILFENDVDCQTAISLSDYVVISKAFEPITAAEIDLAQQYLLKCKYVLDAGAAIGSFNQANRDLLSFAEKNHIPVCKRIGELPL